MGRVTRKKAAEIAEQLHVDEDAVLDMNTDEAAVKANLAAPQHSDRSPLGELEPNSAESENPEEDPVEEFRKSTRSRKAGKKGTAKGKKNDLAAGVATLPEQAETVPDYNDAAPSPASEKAAEELISPEPELVAATLNVQDGSQSPPSAAVRLTRSQLAKRAEAEVEPKSLVDDIDLAPEEGEGVLVADNGNSIGEICDQKDMSETATATAIDAPASPLPSAVPNVIKDLRSDAPGKRSTSNKENVQPESETHNMASPGTPMPRYDALEDAMVAAATPPRSEARSPPRPEDPITALDELEEAVESVSKDIPEVQTSPEKPKSRKEGHVKIEPAGEAPQVGEKKAETKKEAKKAAPVVRTTKAAQARLSLAQNKDAVSKPPSFGRPRPSTTLGRSNSVRQSVAPKLEGASKRVPSNPTTTAAAKSKSLKTSTDGPPREKKEAVIPHSKPRPISLSFPTPPPPSKSTKATTQSTFQLPGEAVAAKLKAAREARLAKEAADAEKAKKVAFKARPAPKASGEVPSVRQTNASRARESTISGKPSAPISHKRSNTVAAVDRPRNTSSTSTKPASTTTKSSTTKPRPSTSLANLSKPRTSTAATSAAPTQRTNSGSGPGISKGKEVFSRHANAKAAAEREKAEKEAAAKRARAEAAERGRVASREWAERQRLRKLGIKPKTEKAQVVIAATEGGDGNGGVGEMEATEAPEVGAVVEV